MLPLIFRSLKITRRGMLSPGNCHPPNNKKRGSLRGWVRSVTVSSSLCPPTKWIHNVKFLTVCRFLEGLGSSRRLVGFISTYRGTSPTAWCRIKTNKPHGFILSEYATVDGINKPHPNRALSKESIRFNMIFVVLLAATHRVLNISLLVFSWCSGGFRELREAFSTNPGANSAPKCQSMAKTPPWKWVFRLWFSTPSLDFISF